MINTMTQENITEELKEAVRVYLRARAAAETIRKRVDRIERAVLQDIVLLDENGERILDPKYTYQSVGDVAFSQYVAECDRRERLDGIKPVDMDSQCCPALVAESSQRDAERDLIQAAVEMLELEPNFERKLYGRNREKFIDLNVRLVFSIPGFNETCKAA